MAAASQGPPPDDGAGTDNDVHRIGAAAEIMNQRGVADAEDRASSRAHRRPAEEAQMGAAAVTDDGVAGFEVTDESGLLVQQRFLQFLGTL
jgi:hypothetical protein